MPTQNPSQPRSTPDFAETMEPRTDQATVRVFYALVPPPGLRHALGDVACELARDAHGRPVPAANVHLTLAFIGAWPTTRLAPLLAAGKAVDGDAMRITLDTRGGFHRAGVAWMGASSPPQALATLVSSLVGQLVANGVSHDERPFHPHVTLARRCRGPYRHDAVGPFAWDVDSTALMQSETRAEGARYVRLARWPLRGARP